MCKKDLHYRNTSSIVTYMEATNTKQQARIERGAMVVEAYGSNDLAVLLTDLAAYANTLGPDAFTNAYNVARARI